MTTMEFVLGQPYMVPEGEGPDWIADTVRDATAGRLAPVMITLFEWDGTRVTGAFSAVAMATDREEDHPSVYLDPLGDSDDPREFRCRDLAGFRLVPERPIDHSDETRGGL
jgi:hypothetical protein